MATENPTIELASRRRLPVPKNPLISERPCDTLCNCAGAISFLESRGPNPLNSPVGEYASRLDLGRSLLFRVIEDAITYEASRLAVWSAP